MWIAHRKACFQFHSQAACSSVVVLNPYYQHHACHLHAVLGLFLAKRKRNYVVKYKEQTQDFLHICRTWRGKKNLHIKIVPLEAHTTFEPKCYLNKSSFHYPTYTNKNIQRIFDFRLLSWCIHRQNILHTVKINLWNWYPSFNIIHSSFIHSLVFSLRGWAGRNQSPVMWPVWLWHNASWARSLA